MRVKTILLFIVLLLTTIETSAQSRPSGEQLFDADWLFHKGGAQGAERVEFDDSTWRHVDLPHDWSIEDLPGKNSPFDPISITGVSGGFTVGGTGWYRKSFKLPAEQKGKRVTLQFDGVYMNAEVWLNGEPVGEHPYGYTSFWFDVTDKLKFGETNVLAVKVQNEGENSRWYSGSGIYRHVWLKVLEPVHVAQWGTYITTPQITTSSARVNAKTKVLNEATAAANITLLTRILNAKNDEAGKNESQQNIAPGSSYEFEQNVLVNTPALWSLDRPTLYTAVTEVYRDGKLSDRVETKFGIRSISVDAVNGFRLNGTTLKLKGGCVHHDNGVLGAKAFDRAEERRVEILKASGFNAIRSAHNPPSQAFLEACDRLGMLVIDETFDMWKNGKNPYDYHLYFNDWWQKDVTSMLLRDRNHPSIVIWSIGNEIPGMEKPETVGTAKMLADLVRRLDPTRPVTAAVNGVADNKDPFFANLDIAGYNYSNSKYESDHLRQPQRVMMATESYALEAFQYWMGVVDHPWVIGDFVWTSFDYIGEASIGWRGYWQKQNFYPWNLAYTGDIDICGWKRPQSYYRDALWKENQLSVFVHPPRPSFPLNPDKQDWSKWNWQDVAADWNWPGDEHKPLQVDVYSSCAKAELFLNGKSLGVKNTDRATQFMATWSVPYEAGELKAVGYQGKDEVAHAELHTATAPTQIKLSADRTNINADGEDLSYITVELVDASGLRHPKAENLVNFTVEGPGNIVGVGNANPVSIESYQQPQRKAWQGRCLVTIKSDKKAGRVILKASSKGLPAASIAINTR